MSGGNPSGHPLGHPMAGIPPVQTGGNPAAAPSLPSAPGPAPISRSPLEQPVAYGSKAASMPPAKAMHLDNYHSAAVTRKAPLAGSEAVAQSSPAQLPTTVTTNAAAQGNALAGVRGFTPAATNSPKASSDAKQCTATAAQIPVNPGTSTGTNSVGTGKRVTLADGKVGGVETVADSAPTAATQVKATEAAFVPRDLQATGPSASSLAWRAAQSQHALKRPQSAPSTTALPASNSFLAKLSSSANVQQQCSDSFPSSPLPQQTSSLAAAASLQARPWSGQPVKGNLAEHALAMKGKSDEQAVPTKGNADGQDPAAAPVQSTLKEQLMPVNGKANDRASGLVAADAAAAAADQRQPAGNDIASPGALTVALSSSQPAADAEALNQHKEMECGATSPTTLTKAVPKSQRRHLLQQDSSKRRRQACMVHLKAARLDTIKWLRSQHAVRIFPVIQPPDHKGVL